MIERSSLPQSPRQRAAIGQAHVKARTILGLAVPTNCISRQFDDGLRVRILPGAFRDVVGGNVELWISHSDRVKLASTKDRTLTLTEQSTGLYIEAVLPDNAEGLAARLAIARGRVVGLSAHFDAATGCSRIFHENGHAIQEISRVGWLREVSLAQSPMFGQTWVRCSPVRDGQRMQDERRIEELFRSLSDGV